MDFPIIDLLDDDQSIAWLEQHFHPIGQLCPHCQAPRADARFFRINSGSGLPVWRCHRCQGIYNLYSGTAFAGSQLAPVHVVLLLRGCCGACDYCDHVPGTADKRAWVENDDTCTIHADDEEF